MCAVSCGGGLLQRSPRVPLPWSKPPLLRSAPAILQRRRGGKERRGGNQEEEGRGSRDRILLYTGATGSHPFPPCFPLPPVLSCPDTPLFHSPHAPTATFPALSTWGFSTHQLMQPTAMCVGGESLPLHDQHICQLNTSLS